MARALVRVGLCLGLSSCLALWSHGAGAQAGDVMEDDSESEPAEEQQSDKDDSKDDDEDGGDWGGEGSAGSGESGFHFGLRLAFGFPLGKATGTSSSTTGGTTTTSGGGKMSDAVTGQIPIWLDLGWQFSPSFMAGAYFSYGFVLPSGDLSDSCDEARASCTLSDIRLGLQAQYSFSPGRGTDPWLGAGIGYEWFNIDVNDASATYHGWELLMIQGGIDFGGDSGGSTIGPFAAFTFGQFTRYHAEFGSLSESADVDETAMHNWLFVGIRGVVK